VATRGRLHSSRELALTAMSYHFSKLIDVPFDQAVARVIEALKGEGFGVLTDFDVPSRQRNQTVYVRDAGPSRCPVNP